MTPTPLPEVDVTIHRLACAGDTEGWALLHSTYKDWVVRRAAAVGGTDDADDVASHVIDRLWRRLPQLPTPIRLQPYMAVMVNNRVIDLRRAVRTIPVSDEVLEWHSRHVEDSASRVAERDLIRRAFAVLSAQQQTVLWRHTVEGEPLGTVAPDVGLSVRAASSVSVRARRRFCVAYLAEAEQAISDRWCKATARQELSRARRNRPAQVRRTADHHSHIKTCNRCPHTIRIGDAAVGESSRLPGLAPAAFIGVLLGSTWALTGGAGWPSVTVAAAATAAASGSTAGSPSTAAGGGATAGGGASAGIGVAGGAVAALSGSGGVAIAAVTLVATAGLLIGAPLALASGWMTAAGSSAVVWNQERKVGPDIPSQGSTESPTADDPDDPAIDDGDPDTDDDPNEDDPQPRNPEPPDEDGDEPGTEKSPGGPPASSPTPRPTPPRPPTGPPAPSDPPVAPVDPVAPTVPPVDPSLPTDPIDPDAPTDPVDPTDPDDPTDPPVDPVDPTDPTEPPVDPPAPTVPPVDPTDPTEPPVDPTNPPVDPPAPTDPPVDPPGPTDPPVDPPGPTDPPVDPSDPPVDPTDPTEPPTPPDGEVKPGWCGWVTVGGKKFWWCWPW